MAQEHEFTRFVIIDAVFVQGAIGGGVYVTVWAKSPNFGNSFAIENAPPSDSAPSIIFDRPFVTHCFSEFPNPDWSETIHSPANNGQVIMIAPKNYERAGFLYADAD